MNFVIEERAGVKVLDWSKRGGAGCRPATEPEQEMWRRLEVAQRLADALETILNLDDGDSPDLWGFEGDFEAGRAALAEWKALK